MEYREDLDEFIGTRIRQLRVLAGYSQSDLAEFLHFDSPTAISLIEKGQRSLKIRDLIILSELFNKDYEYFLDEVPKKKSAPKHNPDDGIDIEAMARRLVKLAKQDKINRSLKS